MKITQAIIATGLIGHATATWNLFGNPFNSPNYNNNECNDKQKSGFDWSGLKDGDSDFSYGSFDFSGGWKCSNSFGKRDVITKRTFGSKCIKNTVSKEKPASFGCSSLKSGFSITHIDVSVEFDVDLELQYHMEDGSTCKQVAPCSSSGSTIQNTQCGGAKSVDVYLPKHHKSGKSSCEIGFHNIGFDCNPGKGYTPPAAPSAPSSSAPVVSEPASTPVVSQPASAPPSTSTTPSCNGDECNSQPPATSSAGCDGGYCASPPPVSSAPATSAPVSSGPATKITVSSGVEVPSSTPEASVPTPPATETASTPCGGYGQDSCEGTTVTSSASVETPSSGVPNTFSFTVPFTNSSAPATTAPPTYETSPVSQPPASQPPASESASMPTCDGSYGESCEGTTAFSTSAASTLSSATVILSTGVPQPSSPSYTPVSPPDVLPKCMNTWLDVSSDCKNNADASCYCNNKDFTKQVIECVSAWCGTNDETREALQYLLGICAEHIPQNPGLVTNCPSYIPLNPTPASYTAPASGVSTPAGEVGTSTAAAGTTPTPESPSGGVTGGVPAETPAASTPCTTITYGTTTITIPQVHFTTQTNDAGATATAPVGLVAGTPAQTPASTTTAAPYPISGTTLATFKPTGTGALSPSGAAQFTGAAAPFKLKAQHAVLGAMLAFFAL